MKLKENMKNIGRSNFFYFFVLINIPINIIFLGLVSYIRINCLSIFHDRFESPILDSYVLNYDELVFILDCWSELFYICVISIVLCIIYSSYVFASIKKARSNK